MSLGKTRKDLLMIYLKRFTHSITMILVIVIIAAIAVIYAQIPHFLGFWHWVDSFYADFRGGFWLLMVITRLLYGAAWLFTSYYSVEMGKKHGFFWFKTEKSYYRSEEESQDKSGEI